MKNLKGIVRNLAIINILAIDGRDYKHSEVQMALDATNDFLFNCEFLLEENLEVTSIVTEYIQKLQYIQEHEEEVQERKRQINYLVDELAQIRRRLQKPDIFQVATTTPLNL